MFYHSLFQHYLQLSGIKSPQDNLQSSNSDSSVCLTLPRNFRLRTEDSEGEEEDEENTPMLQPRAGQVETTSENCEKRRLFRQHTISNPGYQMLMKKLKTSKMKSGETETPELPPRPFNSSTSPECQESPETSDTYIGAVSPSNGSGTWNESEPNSRNSKQLHHV